MTAEYLSEQDLIGQWLEERCDRDAASFERSSELHRDFVRWCERQAQPSRSNMALSASLVSAGFRKGSTMVGRVFHGLKLRPI